MRPVAAETSPLCQKPHKSWKQEGDMECLVWAMCSPKQRNLKHQSHFCSMLEGRSEAVVIMDQSQMSCLCANHSKRQ